MGFCFSCLLLSCNLFVFINGATIFSSGEEKSLKLLYVLFRHGNRTPNGPGELYPKDPYKDEQYYPFGLGQLTNAGKRREYTIGKYFRNRYDEFLGRYYTPNIVEPISTEYNRTEMSLLLVLASLYPPRGDEIWKWNLDWQPIPYNYLPLLQDPYLQGTLCPHYINLYNEYARSPKVQQELKKYKKTFNYISENTGLNITNFGQVYNISFGLRAEEDWGFTLPEWTKKVWPENITHLATQQYFVATGTTELRQMASGYFLKRLISDVDKKINGTKKETKIYLNSAHEDNIASLLIVLGVFNKPHIPNYGAFVLFELHEVNGKYGFKIYYQNYDTDKPKLLKLPACESFCEINKFKTLIEEYIPSDDLCNRQ